MNKIVRTGEEIFSRVYTQNVLNPVNSVKGETRKIEHYVQYEPLVEFIKSKHDAIKPFQHDKRDEGMKAAYEIVLRFLHDQKELL